MRYYRKMLKEYEGIVVVDGKTERIKVMAFDYEEGTAKLTDIMTMREYGGAEVDWDSWELNFDADTFGMDITREVN